MVRCIVWLVIATAFARADDAPDAADLVRKAAARDKELVERRKAFDYDITIIRETLNADNSVASRTSEKVTMRGNVSPSYQTRSDKPAAQAQQQSREEPFEMMKILDHYTYKLDGEESVDGADCWRVAFTPKPDMPYENREEKVLNNVAGRIWIAKADNTLIRNEGSILHPVSVAWIFASLREMEFRFDATLMPNGDFGPGRLMYMYNVSIPFTHLHERDIRIMSNYRVHDPAAK